MKENDLLSTVFCDDFCMSNQRPNIGGPSRLRFFGGIKNVKFPGIMTVLAGEIFRLSEYVYCKENTSVSKR